MDTIELLNNFSDAACAVSQDNRIIYRNTAFIKAFPDFKSMEKFKKRFNFDPCMLSADDLEKTPVDFMLKSKENFHAVCSYLGADGSYRYYYIYSFKYNGVLSAVFKDITEHERAAAAEKRYNELKASYGAVKNEAEKVEKLKEQAQAQVLKMGIINRISLVIRETNDTAEIITSALSEIHNLSGSFKTYFAYKDRNCFKIKYCIPVSTALKDTDAEYEPEILEGIKQKNIIVSSCLKEYLNAPDIMPKGVKRIIIPVYDKNRLLGIIAAFTKQRFAEKDNREILQSISVQLASSIIQADLIHELDKKNKKLAKALSELKETQMQLINSEKTASIGQLAAGIAHEINTPIASISANNGIMRRIINSEETLNKKKLDILKELNSIDKEAVSRISDIVKSLKRYIRLDEAELQKADINSELDLTLKLAKSEVKKNTKIIKNYGVLPEVKCRINMLNQVFMNLIVNACQSIDEKNPEGIIEIITSADKKNLTVKIKDNGIGIPQENKNKIFTAGFTSKKAGIGTGLGLSISKKIIDLHKGSINFTSSEGAGSEFTVCIPL